MCGLAQEKDGKTTREKKMLCEEIWALTSTHHTGQHSEVVGGGAHICRRESNSGDKMSGPLEALRHATTAA